MWVYRVPAVSQVLPGLSEVERLCLPECALSSVGWVQTCECFWEFRPGALRDTTSPSRRRAPAPRTLGTVPLENADSSSQFM